MPSACSAEIAGLATELSASTIPLTVASQRVVLTWLQMGPREMGELVRAYAAGSPAMPCWRAGLAAALADAGRREEAKLEFDRLAADGFAVLPRDNLWLAAMALLAETIVSLDLREHAMDVHAQLAPFAGRNVVLPTVAYLGPVELWLGILARVAGRDAEALEQLAAARIRATRDGAQPTLARIAVEEAAVLVRDGGEAARRRADELLDDAESSCDRDGPRSASATRSGRCAGSCAALRRRPCPARGPAPPPLPARRCAGSATSGRSSTRAARCISPTVVACGCSRCCSSDRTRRCTASTSSPPSTER